MQVERLLKGLIPKCLEKDGIAFKRLENTKSKTKEYRLSALCECRPEGCGSAVELFLWLIEVRKGGTSRCGAGGCISLTERMRMVTEEHSEAEGSGGVGAGVWGNDSGGHRETRDQ